MISKGIPKTFWIVIYPSPNSSMKDICFDADVAGLMRQTRGGLSEEDIVGVYAFRDDAIEKASRLLARMWELNREAGLVNAPL